MALLGRELKDIKIERKEKKECGDCRNPLCHLCFPDRWEKGKKRR